MSYRAFKQSWSGYPLTSPSFAINSSAAYASWNGATDVASWVLLGGSSEGAVSATRGKTSRTGFETQLQGLDDSDSFLAVAAMSSQVRLSLLLALLAHLAQQS